MGDRKEIPEFTAYELNELSRRASDPRKSRDYYAKCLEFIKDTVLNDLFDPEYLTDSQVKWLWGIKRDLAE